jgi:hypothetical protein
MSDRVLLKLNGSSLFSNSWKQELTITESGVFGEVLKDFKRVKMSLPFSSIAQVNIVRGVFKADIVVINSGGTGNLEIKAVTKREAENAKILIEDLIKKTTAAADTAQGSIAEESIAEELRKLADLKKEGILTDEEFQAQKRKLLGSGIATCLLIAITSAATAMAGQTTVGRIGAWEVTSYDAGFCSLETTGIEHPDIILVFSVKPGKAVPTTAVLVERPKQERAPERMNYAFSDQEGKLLANFTTTRSKDGKAYGADISVFHLMTLLKAGGYRTSSKSFPVRVSTSTGEAFQVDLNGAWEAWENTESCAGVD